MTILFEAHDLTVFAADKMICQHFNLQIKTGETIGILGPNGCGKTTLLHALAGLQPITQGKIFLKEKILQSLSQKKIAQSLGILFQHSQDHFPQTVLQFCLSGRHPHLSSFAFESVEDYRMAHVALQVMELENFADKNVKTLSGGERRRLAIAALLTQNPAIYLLDEPTNHLDLHHQFNTLKHFHHLAKNHSASIVMALHDINLAEQFCQKIIMLFGNGEMLQGDTREMLIEKNLSRLYQHPLQSITMNKKYFWIPEVNL